jgi:nitrite reductase/ring-hydroxylating ferredoxin subunit
MTEDHPTPIGPDLAQGIALTDLVDGGKLVGHVGDEQVLLVRRGMEVFAIGALCAHYHGPLVDGLVVDDTVRCPWHHACFDLRTGEALRAPALSPVASWSVEQRDGKIFVREKRSQPKQPRGKAAGKLPGRIVIVGGGAAGFAAAERLRREKYEGSIVMLSNDDAPPVDRPNLSKEYLAGKAPEDWVPLRPDRFYSKNAVELRLKSNVTAIDADSCEVTLANGARSLTTACCSRPALSRFASQSLAPISRMSIRCVRSATAGLSSSAQRQHAGRS